MCTNTLSFENPVLLAPMAGVNDPVFRRICRRMGAGLTYTEMISAAGLAHQNAKSQSLLLADESDRPLAVQLFGHDPQTMAAQAAALADEYADRLALIDINMGCPARKIASKGEGAALMRDPRLAEQIIRAVATAVSLPVTVKFRRGYFTGTETAVEFARMAESAGAAALAVHGRWAEQHYTGLADRTVISRVKAAVGIPVIASGDVYTTDDIADYLQTYSADAVMVARGAQGNPWIFAQASQLFLGRNSGATTMEATAQQAEQVGAVLLSADVSLTERTAEQTRATPLPAQVSLEERVAVAREHTIGLAELLPHRLAAMRKHIAWYFKGIENASEIRRRVNSCVLPEDYLSLLNMIASGELGPAGEPHATDQLGAAAEPHAAREPNAAAEPHATREPNAAAEPHAANQPNTSTRS